MIARVQLVNGDVLRISEKYAMDLQHLIDNHKVEYECNLVQIQPPYIYLNYDDGSTLTLINLNNVISIDFVDKDKLKKETDNE